MSVVPEAWTGRERVDPVDPPACRARPAGEPVVAVTSGRSAAWLRGLDRLAARRPDAVGVSPLALVALDALRASV